MKDPAMLDLLREVADAFNRHDFEAMMAELAITARGCDSG